MEWFSREKKVQFEEDTPTAGDAVRASEDLKRQLKDKTMVIHRKSISGVSLSMMDRYIRVFLVSILLEGVVDALNLNVFGMILKVILLLVLCVYIYRGMWDEGHMDKYFITFSDLKEDRLRGLKVGLLSAAPFIIFYSIVLIAWKSNSQGLFMVYQWCMLPFEPLVKLFLPGGFIGDMTVLKAIFLALIPFLYMGVFVFGYSMGLAGKRILPSREKADL